MSPGPESTLASLSGFCSWGGVGMGEGCWLLTPTAMGLATPSVSVPRVPWWRAPRRSPRQRPWPTPLGKRPTSDHTTTQTCFRALQGCVRGALGLGEAGVPTTAPGAWGPRGTRWGCTWGAAGGLPPGSPLLPAPQWLPHGALSVTRACTRVSCSPRSPEITRDFAVKFFEVPAGVSPVREGRGLRGRELCVLWPLWLGSTGTTCRGSGTDVDGPFLSLVQVPAAPPALPLDPPCRTPGTSRLCISTAGHMATNELLSRSVCALSCGRAEAG